MKTALLLIDIQNDYFPGGKMPLEGSLEAGDWAGKVLSVFRKKGLPLVHIQHLSLYPGAGFFLPETEGVRIHQKVEPLPEERVVQKHYPNSFRETPLLENLKKQDIGHLVITGMMTHMCVDATVRAAFDHGFRCTVLHNACATRDLSFGHDVIPAKQVHAAFMAALGGMYAKVVGVEEYCRGLG